MIELLEKLKAEYHDLDLKVKKLADFINHDMPKKVDCIYHRRALQEQLVCMEMYRQKLHVRISLVTIQINRGNDNEPS